MHAPRGLDAHKWVEASLQNIYPLAPRHQQNRSFRTICCAPRSRIGPLAHDWPVERERVDGRLASWACRARWHLRQRRARCHLLRADLDDAFLRNAMACSSTLRSSSSVNQYAFAGMVLVGVIWGTIIEGDQNRGWGTEPFCTGKSNEI